MTPDELKPKILIADDEKDIHLVYHYILKDRFNLINAFNGKEAVELHKAHRPDLTIMDICMPIMSGDEAINKIREKDPDASIIAVTAAINFTEEGLGVPVLYKGFGKEKLLRTIETALESGVKKRLKEIAAALLH
jgi:two-component system chemotaxis response regulator CheY